MEFPSLSRIIAFASDDDSYSSPLHFGTVTATFKKG